MPTLGTLTGRGILRTGERESAVSYNLDVVHDARRHSLSGHGVLDGDQVAIHQAFEASDVSLILKDGGEVRIIINNMTLGRPAGFLTSGPIPGPWADMIGG